MKVYVVTENYSWYEDYEDHGDSTEIIEVCASKEKAEECIHDLVQKKIVEFDDPFDDSLIQYMVPVFHVCKDGSLWGGVEDDTSSHYFTYEEKEVLE